jgi:acetoin utilization deacetylase AcuC-like enzyme
MCDCDLILYQAGADPHVDDPLGGWLTTEQLRERDRRVFAAAVEWHVPVAWNLAGGYQRTEDGGIGPVLEIHRNTMRECAAAYLTAGHRASDCRATWSHSAEPRPCK